MRETFDGKCGEMKLYHYSKNENLKEVSPAFFGGNSFTANDKNVSDIPRSFFYTKQGEKESFFACGTCYTARIEDCQVYDLRKDNLNVLQAFREHKTTLNDVLYYLRNQIGVSGVLYVSGGYEIVNLFYPIGVQNEIE